MNSRIYTPDRWVVVEFQQAEDITQKILAGWYGGFAGADSWKLSSGVVDTADLGDAFEFLNHSGSIYRCFKYNQGLSFLTQSILNSWLEECKSDPDLTIKVYSDYPTEEMNPEKNNGR